MQTVQGIWISLPSGIKVIWQWPGRFGKSAVIRDVRTTSGKPGYFQRDGIDHSDDPPLTRNRIRERCLRSSDVPYLYNELINGVFVCVLNKTINTCIYTTYNIQLYINIYSMSMRLVIYSLYYCSFVIIYDDLVVIWNRGLHRQLCSITRAT